MNTPHTGTQRISTLKMYPMSLYESLESNGSVSLIDLFNHPDQFDGCQSYIDLDDIIFAICRGGWPRAINNKTKQSQLEIAKDLFKQTYTVDISNIDDVKRNPMWSETILRSYARNICTLAKKSTILADVEATCSISKSTFFDYESALEKLYIIENIHPWSPSIRSKSAIRASNKINFIDPSIAVAALGLSPEYFNLDFKTLSFLFESLCIRDLIIYSSKCNGKVSYYHDRYGLEADAVLHLEDGRYALIEIKLGANEIDDGARHLCEIEKLINDHNKIERQVPIRLPDLKIVLTGTEYGYRRDDGVLVIPIGCLKD